MSGRPGRTRASEDIWRSRRHTPLMAAVGALERGPPPDLEPPVLLRVSTRHRNLAQRVGGRRCWVAFHHGSDADIWLRFKRTGRKTKLVF